MMRLTLLCVAIFALSGCASKGPRSVPDSSCAAFQVIHPAREDTLDTKRQVLAHNTIYRKLCGAK